MKYAQVFVLAGAGAAIVSAAPAPNTPSYDALAARYPEAPGDSLHAGSTHPHNHPHGGAHHSNGLAFLRGGPRLGGRPRGFGPRRTSIVAPKDQDGDEKSAQPRDLYTLESREESANRQGGTRHHKGNALHRGASHLQGSHHSGNSLNAGAPPKDQDGDEKSAQPRDLYTLESREESAHRQGGTHHHNGNALHRAASHLQGASRHSGNSLNAGAPPKDQDGDEKSAQPRDLYTLESREEPAHRQGGTHHHNGNALHRAASHLQGASRHSGESRNAGAPPKDQDGDEKSARPRDLSDAFSTLESREQSAMPGSASSEPSRTGLKPASNTTTQDDRQDGTHHGNGTAVGANVATSNSPGHGASHGGRQGTHHGSSHHHSSYAHHSGNHLRVPHRSLNHVKFANGLTSKTNKPGSDSTRNSAGLSTRDIELITIAARAFLDDLEINQLD